MKRIIALFIFLLVIPFVAQAARTYSPTNNKLYVIGKDIIAGSYSLEFDKKDRLNFASVTVGNDLMYTPGTYAVLIKNGEYKEYQIDKNNPSLVLNLIEGNKLFVNAGSPRLIPQNIQNTVAKPTSIEIKEGLYLVGKDIDEGLYAVAPVSSGKYPTVFYGDYHYASNPVSPQSGEFTKTIMKDSEIKLDFGKYIRVSGGSVSLKSIDASSVSSKNDNDQKNSTQTNKLTTDEVKKITSKAPYVSSKNIIIDSPEGIDFYTYFGSGIIMSGASGDCFKMVECDDEPIVDHYKIMPIKTGKGKIEYVINMKKKIIVNITVKDSAFKEKTEINAGNATTARAVKSVNIREKATTDSKKVGSLKKGETVSVITPYYTDGWHEISYKNKTCYVSANFVEIE